MWYLGPLGRRQISGIPLRTLNNMIYRFELLNYTFLEFFADRIEADGVPDAAREPVVGNHAAVDYNSHPHSLYY